MPRFINEECIACGACAGECPTNAISEGDGKYVVDENECIDCGACDSSCPTGAIKEK
ncbi:MAG: 4Fe-4S binding protein [Firmicutes bacterium]|nr:4Fe-4S binding protein [Bacillota bacterium]